ncbi:UNVERIFIED_CONTAM: hypothetical protein Scaly_2999400 [Sesamum calycinum]|uniref:ATP-dependent DNA helicase n=1 Tax=Sesamum calycinum TaxID=2727403 RepID=A0AAW2KF21_9LAMI
MALHFKANSRRYNNVFAFTSFGVNYDKELCHNDKNVYTFRVQGLVYHFLNDLIPKEGKGTNLQLYFHDVENEVNNRLAVSELKEELVLMIMKLLEVNPYSLFFRSLREIFELHDCRIVLRADPGLDQRVYNIPVIDQVAAIWKDSDECDMFQSRDIRVYPKSDVHLKLSQKDLLKFKWYLFIDGPGGSGKTFLYRALLADVRSKGYIALAVATSGVAAALLPGGRTAYSRFKIPIDLMEKNGTKVQAVIYNPDMSLMEDVLQLQETYYISNAKVTFVEPKYRMVPNMYQWIISRTTVIRRVIDDSLPRELGAPEFKKFVDIPLFLGSNSLIDVLAIVVDKLEQRSINTKYGMSTIQEFVIVNDERKPMILTLWNEVVSTEGAAILAADKMPIIAATRLHVTDYHGISLSARGFANIIVNPSYSETTLLGLDKKKTVDTHYGIGYHYNVSSLIEEDVDQLPKVRVEECSSSHSYVVDLSTAGADNDLNVAATSINAHLLQSSNDSQDVASSSISPPK